MELNLSFSSSPQSWTCREAGWVVSCYYCQHYCDDCSHPMTGQVWHPVQCSVPSLYTGEVTRLAIHLPVISPARNSHCSVQDTNIKHTSLATHSICWTHILNTLYSIKNHYIEHYNEHILSSLYWALYYWALLLRWDVSVNLISPECLPRRRGGESVQMPCNDGHYVQAREMNGVRRFVPDDQSARARPGQDNCSYYWPCRTGCLPALISNWSQPWFELVTETDSN